MSFYLQLSANDILDLQVRFESDIEPICLENNFTLHECFEYLRNVDDSLYSVLSNLWHTRFGKSYLRDRFRGGRLCVK